MKWLPIMSSRRWPSFVVAAGLLYASYAARAQGITVPQFPNDVPLPPRVHKPPKFLDRYPEKPSLPPAFTIPFGSLGFSPPGVIYLLRRQSLISLDFLDEDRLLVSFQAPGGLIPRDNADNLADEERHIRAVVVALPSGNIESEAQWNVTDRSRYLWMLRDGHFLLRDSDGLEQGDATLKITPSLRLPGRLLWLAMDPTLQVIITNSLEPPDAKQDPSQTAAPAIGPAAMTADKQKPGVQPTLVVRTFRRESGQLIRTARVPWASQSRDWPFNSEGYLETSRDSSGQWVLTLNYFTGGINVVARVDSGCEPTSDFVSEGELLATTCEPVSGGDLQAMTAIGARLWETRTSSNEMWPLLVNSPNGSRVARETLLLKRASNRYKNLVGAADLDGQIVRVFDAANGNVRLEAPLSPMFDGGGNVAISPSGRRVAILNAGAIQVFELPAPPPIPPATLSIPF